MTSKKIKDLSDEELTVVLRDAMINGLLQEDELRYEAMTTDELLDLYKVVRCGLECVDGEWRTRDVIQ